MANQISQLAQLFRGMANQISQLAQLFRGMADLIDHDHTQGSVKVP